MKEEKKKKNKEFATLCEFLVCVIEISSTLSLFFQSHLVFLFSGGLSHVCISAWVFFFFFGCPHFFFCLFFASVFSDGYMGLHEPGGFVVDDPQTTD